MAAEHFEGEELAPCRDDAQALDRVVVVGRPDAGAAGQHPEIDPPSAARTALDLDLRMRGAQGMERLALKLGADGRWQADLALAGLPQETAEALKSSGFDTRPDGVGIVTGGTF